MNRVLPAEWYPQSAVQLTWPHSETDWAPYLEESENCFIAIAQAIAERQKLLIVCKNKKEVSRKLSTCNTVNIYYAELPSNDTWARDHAALSVLEKGQAILLDFKFNGWGLKYAANLDNKLNRRLWEQQFSKGAAKYENHLSFVLEGGSIESDGAGTLMTTSQCLLAPNRNGGKTKAELEVYLKKSLGADRLLWLENGFLAGDDTDGHIDTLARFCNPNTIAYVQCQNHAEEHYPTLQKMEQELKEWTTKEGAPYQLVPLPMADPIYENSLRLPATYANFLILNEAVLLPFYGSPKDQLAQAILQEVFQDRTIIGIDCRALIKQGGSLHCVTMQYPKEVNL